MNLRRISGLLSASFLFLCVVALTTHAQNGYARATAQPIDDEYTKKIAEYTTEKFFNSPLTDYLPASPNVPTPKAVLGDVAGAPGKLPYAKTSTSTCACSRRRARASKFFPSGRRKKDAR
jgi:hypothetical protein